MTMRRVLKTSGLSLGDLCWKPILELRRKIGVKKNLTRFGKISISNDHVFSKGNNGFQISPRMQELMIFAGQSNCYEKSNEVLERFLSISVSAAQVYRVTDLYGEQIGKEEDFNERSLTPVRKEDTLYVETDGSMVFTREEGWKEVKAGRIFKASDSIRLDGKPGYISHSQYMAHLGDHKTFSTEMESLIESYDVKKNHLVFISDGAPWIRNWIEDAFPDAVSILDFYHASEHLHGFVEQFFKDKKAGSKWAEKQKELLLEGKVTQVIKNIKSKAGPENEAAKKLIDYYSANNDRMDYKKYKQIGCGIIGSGAIESTHRTLIQERMKLSGQRWSKTGAQNMLNLRVTNLNGNWNKIIKLVKTDFIAAA